jgi:16S rRNA (guanine1207-N2)-methyltransferase
MRDRELKLTRRCEDVLTQTRPEGEATLWCGLTPSDRRRGDAVWLRYAAAGRPASALPEVDAVPTFGVAVVRLDKAREATQLALSEAQARLRPSGVTLLFGANDEGIRSFDGRDGFVTVDTGGHGRVLARPASAFVGAPRAGLAAWRRTRTAHPLGTAHPWVEYPGCFALGGDDAGSVLLLDSLRAHPAQPGATLDFGCGPGFLSAGVRALWAQVPLLALDRDALALEALRENVPTAQPVLADSVDAARPLVGAGLSLIVSNPPFHDGHDRTHAAWLTLVQAAPTLLAPGGELRLVVQRNVRVEPALRAHFGRVDAVVVTPQYAVWRALK